MNKIKFFVILTIGILLFSCKEKDKSTKEVEAFYSYNNIHFDKELKICVILPEVGCGGCIASGVSFFQENKDYFSRNQNKNRIIFTAIHSKKMLYRTLGVNSLNEYNCFLDETNKFLVKGNNSIYPLILYLENGYIVKAEYQSPYSKDLFSELKSRLEDAE